MNYIVGVMPLYDEQKESIWMLPNYLKMIEAANLTPFIFPYTTNKVVLKQLIEQVDGLLFTGGHDIDPSYYGQQKLPACGEVLPIRDELEYFLFNEAIRKDIPILGICRGLQLFNVLSGGTLYQDLPSQYNTNLKHAQKPPYHVPVHEVNFTPQFEFAQWLGQSNYAVNSLHHQAINQLGSNIDVLAVSEDGLIEGIKIRTQSFAIAVQWHPEYMQEDDEFTLQLLAHFYSACQDYSFIKGL